MTYILVQKEVIHSVTVKKKKKLHVYCFGEQRRCHLGGQLQSINVVVGHAGARAAIYWDSLASVWKRGHLHSQPHRAAISIGSTSPCLQIRGTSSICIQFMPVIASPWNPVQSTASPTFIWGSADSKSGLSEASFTMDKRWPGKHFSHLSLTREKLSMKKGDQSYGLARINYEDFFSKLQRCW